MNNPNLHGVVVPIITPTDDRENVDEAAMRLSIRRLIGTGVNALFAGGSAGEGPLLGAEAWRRMAEIGVEECRGKVPFLCGVMDTSVRRVRDRIKVLSQIGCRYFVLTPTFYISVATPDEHLRLFGEAKQAAGNMEMIAYNIPQCTGSVLAVETIVEMARRGWIVACKESSGNWEYHQGLLRRAGEIGLTVLVGDEKISGDALLAGARGVVPVCANYDPAVFLGLCHAAARNDRAEVSRLMTRVETLRQTLPLSGPCWLSGIKYALAALGIGSGQPVSPLEPCSSERKARIDAFLQSDRLSGA
jgi:4-hydroxy-tetrahydrodipicolinate synthase